MEKEENFDNYKCIKTIGEGTFGKVKLAKHIPTGEKVAIKILEKSLIHDSNEFERIEKEIKYLKLFNHPNIIQIYEVIENSQKFCIVMEYAEGGELFNYIVEKEKLTEKETSFYFCQILNAVKTIHEKKICHRDIKPENLLFTSNKILKLIDFGLSNEYENLLSTPCGSPCYASPEIILGENYDGLSIDLWACGVILFAMLCGYLPFDDNDNDVLFKKILDRNIDYPTPDETLLSNNALDLINKILIVDPKKRISLNEIMNHPFLNFGKELYKKIIQPEFFDKQDLIIDYMVNELHYSNENNKIIEYLNANRHNNYTTTYKLLKKKYLEGRLEYQHKKQLIRITPTIISHTKKYYQNNSKNKKSEEKTINSHFKLDEEKSYNTLSVSESPKNLKVISKKKQIPERNNIIIINNTNMIQHNDRLKSICNDLISKQESELKNFIRKIETSVSVQKKNKCKINTSCINSQNIISDNNILIDLTKNSKNENNLIIKKGKNILSEGQIKVSLKKDEKTMPQFIPYKKCKIKDSLQKKYIFLPSSYYIINKKPNNCSSNKTLNSYYITDSSVNYLTNTNNNVNNISNSQINKICDTSNFSTLYSNNSNNNNFNYKIISNSFIKKIPVERNSSSRNKIKKNGNNVFEFKIKQRDSNQFDNSNINHYIKKISTSTNNRYKNLSLVQNIGQGINKIKKINHRNNIKFSNDNSINNQNLTSINQNFTRNSNIFSTKIISRENSTFTNRKDVFEKNKNEITHRKINKLIELKPNLSPRLIKRYTYVYFTDNKKNNKKTVTSKIRSRKKNNYFANNNTSKILEKAQKHTITVKEINVNNNSNPKNIYINKRIIDKNHCSQKTNKTFNKIKHISNTSRNEKNEMQFEQANNGFVFCSDRGENNKNISRNINVDNHNSINYSLKKNELVPCKFALTSRNRSKIKNKLKKDGAVTERKSYESKKVLIIKKPKENEAFFVANTSLNITQIGEKIIKFSKKNNLDCKKEGWYFYYLSDKKGNKFTVEVSHNNPSNIVKFFMNKGVENKAKEMITKLFIDIVNY